MSDRGNVRLTTQHVIKLCEDGERNLNDSYSNVKVVKVCSFSFRKFKKVCRDVKSLEFCHNDIEWTRNNISQLKRMCKDIEKCVDKVVDNDKYIWLNLRVYNELLNLNNDVYKFNPYWFGNEY